MRIQTSVKGKTNRLGHYVVTWTFQKNLFFLVHNFDVHWRFSSIIWYCHRSFCKSMEQWMLQWIEYLVFKVIFFTSVPPQQAQAKAKRFAIREDLFHIA